MHFLYPYKKFLYPYKFLIFYTPIKSSRAATESYILK